MNVFVLKMIAIITMLIDHIGATFFLNSEIYYPMRLIGRIAFPIFAFLIVEGYFHTRNVRNYIIRLLIFAFISEIPFDLCFQHTIFAFGSQNIFFNLALGLLTIHCLTLVSKRFDPNHLKGSLLTAGIVIASMVIATVGRFDYQAYGIVYMLVFYYMRGKKIGLALAFLFVNVFLFGSHIQVYASLAILFLLCYNGEKGRSLKYFFYAFYPVHLCILFLLQIYR